MTTTRVITIAEDLSRSEGTASLTEADLTGEYTAGNRPGFELYLKLNPAGSFECDWSGCMGPLGTASGQWSVGTEGVELSADRAEGMLDGYLGVLPVVTYRGHLVLVIDNLWEFFDKWGLDRYCCFHRPEASDDLIVAEIRRNRV